jgi:hypothetical protein
MEVHWTDDELLGRLYGLAPAGNPRADAHLAACESCRGRWASLMERRAAVLVPPVADEQRLRAQREAVWARIERRPSNAFWRAVPVAATALLLVVGVALHVPAPAPVENTVASVQAQHMSDEQLMADIYSVIDEETPGPVQPIRALFASGEGIEVQ